MDDNDNDNDSNNSNNSNSNNIDSNMVDSDPNNNSSQVVAEQQRKLLLEAHLLDRLIRSNEWDRVYEVFHQSSCRGGGSSSLRLLNRIVDVNKTCSGDSCDAATRLHWICAIGSAPPKLIDLVASLDPQAVSLPDTNRHYDTPLHIIARNSQTSSTKMKILIKYLKQYDPQCEALETRTRFGGTVLHSAANHNAMLEVIQMIVYNNPNILKVRTTDGIHAVSALWSSYIQTIPGYMIVARILDGDDVRDENHFQKLWKKAEFLASEYFALTRSAPPSLLLKKTAAAADVDHSDDVDDVKKKAYALHGLLQCVSNVAINFFKVALRQPNSRITTNACDADGNLPLHRLLRDRPFRLKEVEAIQDMVEANSDAVYHANNNGDIPLTIAIRNKMSWDCIRPIVNANPDTVRYQYQCRDDIKGTDGAGVLLYPFQLAACVGGKYAFEITYQLLLIQPDLLSVKQQQQQQQQT